MLVENSEISNLPRLRENKRKTDAAENFEKIAAWENDLFHSRSSLGRRWKHASGVNNQ